MVKKRLYICPLSTALAKVIIHKITYSNDIESILLVGRPVVVKCGVDLPTMLEGEKIFSKVIVFDNPKKPTRGTTIEEQENIVVQHCSSFLKSNSINLDDIDIIYVVNDNFSVLFNLFFNIKKIEYVWIEMVKNHYNQGVNLDYELFPDLYNKYNAYGGLAPYAKLCVNSSSDITKKKLEKKIVMEWNPDKCLEELPEKYINSLANVFSISCLNLTDMHGSFVLIKNSYGYLDWKMSDSQRCSRLFRFKTRDEYYAEMDLVTLDYYGDINTKSYIKYHIHDWRDSEKTKQLYGSSVDSLPNVPMEFLNEYLCINNISFKRSVVIASSTSIVTNNLIRLGEEYIRTWWYLDEMYCCLKMYEHLDVDYIFSSSNITGILRSIEDKDGISELSNEKWRVEKSLIICDCLFESEININSIDNSSILALLNVEESDRVSLILDSRFIPMNCIKIKNDRVVKDTIIWLMVQNYKNYESLFAMNVEVYGGYSRTKTYFTMISEVKEKIIKSYYKKYVHQQNFLKSIDKRMNRMLNSMTNVYDMNYIIGGIDDATEYLSYLNYLKKDLVIIMGVKDSPGISMSENILNLVKGIGFSKFKKQLWFMYNGVVCRGNVMLDVVSNKVEENLISNVDVLNHPIELISMSWRRGNHSSIKVDNVDYSVNSRGINIVVLDANMVLVDSVSIDCHTPNVLFKRIRKKILQ